MEMHSGTGKPGYDGWDDGSYMLYRMDGMDGMDAGHKNCKMSLAAGQRGQHVA